MHPRAIVQSGLAALVAAAALFMLAPTGYGAAPSPQNQAPTPTATPTCPAGEFFDPVMNRCRLIQPECPAGKIDVYGDGLTCEDLDPIARPATCVPTSGPDLLTPQGYLECALPWMLNGQRMRLAASVGCLDVQRSLYPRALVNVPVEFTIERLLPASQLGISLGLPGSYRVLLDPWAAQGLYLHEFYPLISADSFGRPAFDTRATLANDPYRYPSLNNVRAYLVFRLRPDDSQFAWTTDGFPLTLAGGLSEPVTWLYTRSSYPLPQLSLQYSMIGPSATGQNNLPAFRLRVRTSWDLLLVTEWDNYYVNGARAYTRGAHESYAVTIGQGFRSYRAWDSRQPRAGTGLTFCNAAQGYIPLPVIEAQTVLIP